VGGTGFAPDDTLLEHVGAVLSRFAEVEKQAVEFLRAREAAVRRAGLKVYGLEIPDQKHADDFSLEFLADGDDSRVWRVEFESGQPKLTGFDD
jgi:hypothetical protein